MSLILLSLLCNCDKLILKLHRKKLVTSKKGGFLLRQIQNWKCDRNDNKEVLAQFIYKRA